MTSDNKCVDCGHPNEPQAAFCGNCGSPMRTPRARPPAPPSTLPEEIGPTVRLEDARARDSDSGGLDASSHMECPSCHCPAEQDDLFCRRCGARLVQRPSYCKRCGDPVDTDEAFCNRCGLPLG